MIAWGITYLIHSTLLISAVWLACRVLRSTSARETLWKIALVAPLITATIPPIRPVQADGLKPVSTVGSRQVPSVGTGFSPSRPSPLDIPKIAKDLWMAGAALLLLRLLIGRALLTRALRDRVPLEHDLLPAHIRLTESAAITSPIAMPGWEIVVPRGTFARLNDEQQKTILAHEIAHLQRRDPLWLLAGETIKALLFVQPLNWLAHARMKECAEYLCDDVAVRQTENPRALAETLAELATAYARPPRAVAAMAESGSNLTARVARVLEGNHEQPLHPAARLGIAAAAVALLAAFAPAISTPPGAPHESIHFDDGALSRTFDGPDGETTVKLTAKDLNVADDASSYHFTSANGFLRVRQTSARGAAREIDATPSASHYRVGGAERPWDDEARRMILAAFRAEQAYVSTVWPRGVVRIAPRRRSADPAHDLKSWDANVSMSGRGSHSIKIHASGVRYDRSTGDVFFAAGAFLDVTETTAEGTRIFHRDAGELTWSGPFDHIEVSEWLADILHEQTRMPMNVATNMGRE